MKNHLTCAALAALFLAACDSKAVDNSAEPAEKAPAAGATDAAGASASADRTPGLYPGVSPGSNSDRYTTGDPIDRVIAWYRDDSARRSEMMFVSTERQDDGYLVVGTAGDEGRSFALKLSPRSGGTEIEVLPYDPKTGLKP